MNIKLKKEEDGVFSVKNKIDFAKVGLSTVSVECSNQGCDPIHLKKETESYLNQQALIQGMRVKGIISPQASIPVKVEKGESARVKRLDFPVEVLPQEGKTH